MPEKKEQTGLALKEREEIKAKKPRKYNVLLHNDDYTPMEFVVNLLTGLFRHKTESAVLIMLHIHNKGVGIAGTYTHEIAETKMYQAIESAKQADWPLMATIEPVDDGEE